MGYSINCRDVGIDCDDTIEGKTEEELFANVFEHARTVLGMEVIPEEIKARMRRLLREDKAA